MIRGVDEPALRHDGSQPAAVVRVPQGLVHAYVLPTELLAVMENGDGLPLVTERVLPEAAACFDERLGAEVLAHLLAHLARSQSTAAAPDHLRGRVMWMTPGRDWCPEQEIGLQVDTAAGPIDLTLWTDIDWPGVLVHGPEGAGLMCIGGKLPRDETAGCEALTALLSGDRGAFVRHVRRGRLLPSVLDPHSRVLRQGVKGRARRLGRSSH